MPVYIYIIFISSGLESFDPEAAGFSTVVMLISRVMKSSPVFLIVCVFLMFVVKVTLRSVARYRKEDAPYTFFHLFFVDLINAFLFPLLLLIMISAKTSSILLIFAFVFMMSLAEPMKMTTLNPGKKAFPMKEVLPLSFVVTLIFFVIVLIFIVSALPFVIFSCYSIIVAVIVLSLAEHIYRQSYTRIYEYLERKALNG